MDSANLDTDVAYDKTAIYKLLQAKEISGKIPLRKDAKLQEETKKPWISIYNKAINRIRELGKAQIETGRKKWKEEIGYDKRSLVETAMWRFKGIFGGHFKSRKFENQETA